MPHPPPEAERQAGNSQRRKVRGNLRPRDAILHWTVSRLPVANQVFLGSWTADVHLEGCSQRSAPQRRHTTERALSRCAWETEPGTGEVIKTCSPPGTVRSPSACSPERLGPGRDMQGRAHFGQCPASTLEPECSRKAHTPWARLTQCGPDTVSPPHTHQWYLFPVLLSPHTQLNKRV